MIKVNKIVQFAWQIVLAQEGSPAEQSVHAKATLQTQTYLDALWASLTA